MAIRAVCNAFGEEFTIGSLLPTFMAASALSSFQAKSISPPLLAEVVELQSPQVCFFHLQLKHSQIIGKSL